jgi:hypothetical protein
MVFNDAFNNMSLISWRSILLMEEIGVTGKTTDLLQVTDRFYHIMWYLQRIALNGIRTGTGNRL